MPSSVAVEFRSAPSKRRTSRPDEMVSLKRQCWRQRREAHLDRHYGQQAESGGEELGSFLDALHSLEPDPPTSPHFYLTAATPAEHAHLPAGRGRAQAGNTTSAHRFEEVVVESVAYTVCAGLGLDTSGDSVTYLAGRGGEEAGDQMEACAALIDPLADRIEDFLLAACCFSSATPARHANPWIARGMTWPSLRQGPISRILMRILKKPIDVRNGPRYSSRPLMYAVVNSANAQPPEGTRHFSNRT